MINVFYILKYIMLIIKPWLEDKAGSEIAINAARAPFFLVFNDQDFIKSIKNPFVSWWGAWFAVADLLKDEWCELFIAKKIWDNMKNRLEEIWINYQIIE